MGSKGFRSYHLYQPVILSLNNFPFLWSVITKTIRTLFSPHALPGACRSICKGLIFFIIICHVLMNHWTFSIYKLLCSFSFLLHFFLFKDGYPLHTPTLTKCRYPSTPDSMGDYSALAFGNSEDLINHAEYEVDEDCEEIGRASCRERV